ncbi:MAG: hypothetical protein WDA75_12100 [Candidatus Latescibacterota bacterium]|jgi:hypothetical protein
MVARCGSNHGPVRRTGLATGPALALAWLLAGGDPVSGVDHGVAADTTRGPSPRGALCRSLLIPGWGQLANGRPVKAIVCGVTSAALLASVVARQRSLDEATTALDHQDRAGRRNTGLLLLGLSITLSALDAYVDAQLRGFTTAEVAVSLQPAAGGAMVCLSLMRPGRSGPALHRGAR